MLTRTNNHRFSCRIFAVNHNLTIRIRRGAIRLGIDVSSLRVQCPFAQMIYFSAILRHNHTLILFADSRLTEPIDRQGTQRLTSIVFLTIEDSCMNHRTCNACLPKICIRTIQTLCPVSEGQFKYTTKSTLLSVHAIRATGRNDFVSPPSRRHLRCQHVRSILLGLKLLRNVVCERILRAAMMREAWS